MALKTATIRFKGRRAGILTETAGGGTRFTYDAEWRDDIACCLPASRREHEWADGLHPFFQHLGPEGWLREKQARTAHVVEDDDFALLLRYGADCIGAVSILPPPDAAPLAPITELSASPGRTVSGVQKKLLATRDGPRGAFQAATAEGAAPYIAKFNSPALDTLVRNEALSLRWTAAVLGKQEVTDFTVAPVDAFGMALVVTRFDRTPEGGRLRLEDFAQILCKPRGRAYEGKYEASYEEAAAVVARHSARPAIDLARFHRRLIASALVGNCDAHLKNFSLLETAGGLRLSPAYDVVNTALYDGYDRELALTIDGSKTPLDRADGALFRDFGARIGLTAPAIEQNFTFLARQTRRAASLLEPPAGEGPDGFVTRFSEIVSTACLRILGA